MYRFVGGGHGGFAAFFNCGVHTVGAVIVVAIIVGAVSVVAVHVVRL